MSKAMNILYSVGDGLYINLTNRCSCACTFCIRDEGDALGSADTLWLEREPTAEEVISALKEVDLSPFSEVVFCGYGEPTEAFEVLKEVATWLKANTDLPVRINTNGQGSLICERDITPELEGIIDALSISLNTPDPESYLALTRSRYGKAAFDAVLDFAKRAKQFVPSVTLTTVSTTITVEQEAECARICDSLGATYRIRTFV